MKISGQFSPAVQNHLQLMCRRMEGTFVRSTSAMANKSTQEGFCSATEATCHLYDERYEKKIIVFTSPLMVVYLPLLYYLSRCSSTLIKANIPLVFSLRPLVFLSHLFLKFITRYQHDQALEEIFISEEVFSSKKASKCVLVTGFMGMALCFSATAAVGNSPKLLILGVLSYDFTLTFWLCCFLSFFSPSLVCGLPFFLGYFTFDTLQIIESTQTEDHDHDYLKHALTLSTDFFALLSAYPFIMAKSGRSIRRWLYGKEEGSSDGNGTGEGGSQYQEVPI